MRDYPHFSELPRERESLGGFNIVDRGGSDKWLLPEKDIPSYCARGGISMNQNSATDWIAQIFGVLDATVGTMVLVIVGIIWGAIRVFFRVESLEKRQASLERRHDAAVVEFERKQGLIISDLKADIREDLGELKNG